MKKLLCVDIVCHGVPSPKVWKAYLLWQEQKTIRQSGVLTLEIRENMVGEIMSKH